jgi:hypothetical protein
MIEALMMASSWPKADFMLLLTDKVAEMALG